VPIAQSHKLCEDLARLEFSDIFREVPPRCRHKKGEHCREGVAGICTRPPVARAGKPVRLECGAILTQPRSEFWVLQLLEEGCPRLETHIKIMNRRR
jgi:hypothetical protein